MIYYPIKTLTDADIDNILIVTGREHTERLIEILVLDLNYTDSKDLRMETTWLSY